MKGLNVIRGMKKQDKSRGRRKNDNRRGHKCKCMQHQSCTQWHVTQCEAACQMRNIISEVVRAI